VIFTRLVHYFRKVSDGAENRPPPLFSGGEFVPPAAKKGQHVKEQQESNAKIVKYQAHDGGVANPVSLALVVECGVCKRKK